MTYPDLGDKLIVGIRFVTPHLYVCTKLLPMLAGGMVVSSFTHSIPSDSIS